MKANPYDFLNPVRRPELFAGRHKELEEIDYYLELCRGENPTFMNLALIGTRAAGKTSFLHMIAHQAQQKALLPVKISLNNELVQRDILFFKEVIDAIKTEGAKKGMYKGISGWKARFAHRTKGTFELSGKVPLPGIGEIQLAKKSKNSDFSPSQSIVIDLLRKLYQRGKEVGIRGIVLLLDECDLFSQNETLLQKVRNIFTDVEGYLIVLSGTDKMFPAVSEVFSPIPRSFKRINVSNFSTIEETRECVLKPLTEDERKLVDEGSIQEIHALSQGSPYEIQLICHYMYRRCKEMDSPNIKITIDVLNDILSELERLRKSEHHVIADRIRILSQDELKLLVSLLEFPGLTQDELVQALLLTNLASITIENKAVIEAELRIRISNFVGNILKPDDQNRLRFVGDQFDLLYIKYTALAKGLKDFVLAGIPEPQQSLHHALLKGLLKEIPEYWFHTRFDKRELITLQDSGLIGRSFFIVGAQVSIPAGQTRTILEFTPAELQRQFYEGRPDSIRFRINLKDGNGFVTQIRINIPEKIDELRSRLPFMREKLDLLGIQLLEKDEIAWWMEGAQFYQKGDHQKALECLEKSLSINKDLEYAWETKGLIHFDRNEYDLALECFDHALSIWPRFARAMERKAWVFINTARNEEAIQWLDKSLDIEPNNPSGWDNRGRALLNLKRFEEAAKSFERAIKLNPSNLDALSFLAQATAATGKLEEALQYWDTVLQQDNERIDAKLNKAVCLSHLKRTDEALSILEEILISNTKSIEALILKGIILSNLNRIEEAIVACQAILELEPQNPIGWYNLSCFEAKEGRVDPALEHLEHALNLSPELAVSAVSETDFAKLRGNPKFEDILSRFKVKIPPQA